MLENSLSQYALPFLGNILFHLPLFVVWCFALYLSLDRWEKHPQVSQLTAIASIMFIGLSIIQAGLIFVQLEINRIWTIEQMGWILAACNFLIVIVSAIAWCLILKAIFGWRKDVELF